MISELKLILLAPSECAGAVRARIGQRGTVRLVVVVATVVLAGLVVAGAVGQPPLGAAGADSPGVGPDRAETVAGIADGQPSTTLDGAVTTRQTSTARDRAVGAEPAAGPGPASQSPTDDRDRQRSRARPSERATATATTVGEGTDPAGDGVDSDGDGLADAVERDRYGTDPTDPDTDGDGYPDGMEVNCTGGLPGADPLVQDVYVEVDVAAGATLSDGAVADLKRAFATAPVENPNGERGVRLHVIRSDAGLPVNGSVDSDRGPEAYDDVTDYRSRHADYDGLGYYYLLVAPDVAYDGDPYYAGAGSNGTAAVESYASSRVMTSLVMHELGHAFGLDRDRPGVDDRRYAADEYRSVMNYNAIYAVATYSDGSDRVGRDEWAYVAERRHVPAIDPAACGP